MRAKVKGVGVCEMLKCQITLADMGPENSGDSLCVCVYVSLCEHRRGGGALCFLHTSGTRKAGDKPWSISIPHSVSACSCRTSRVPCTDNPKQQKPFIAPVWAIYYTTPKHTCTHTSMTVPYTNVGNSSYAPYLPLSISLQHTQAHCINHQQQTAPAEG